MDTKKIILDKLGLEKLGKKSTRLVGYDADGTKVHDYFGDEVAMEVMRVTGKSDFVLGRYDKKARLYRVAFDPNMKAGNIKSIINVYTQPKSGVRSE